MGKALEFLETNRRLRNMTESSKILKESETDFKLEECFDFLIDIYNSTDKEQRKKFVYDLTWVTDEDLNFKYKKDE